MLTPPLLGRAVELHQQDCRDDVAHARPMKPSIVGTRTRGGIFHLSMRSPRPEREQPRHEQPLLARPRPWLPTLCGAICPFNEETPCQIGQLPIA
jgi:hypothetical protein